MNRQGSHPRSGSSLADLLADLLTDLLADLLTGMLAILLALQTLVSIGGCQREPTPVPLDRPLVLGGQTIAPARLRRGAAAFTHYCRPCHGDAGDGAGPSGRGLQPPPRDLRLGVYKFAAVATGQLPNDSDLRRIIKGGLHGTAMLAWDVPDPELDDLIQYVKAFSPRWLTEKAGEPIVLGPDPWSRPEGVPSSGDPGSGSGVDPGERPNDAAIERGQRVYHGLAQCAVACHPAYVTRAEIFAFTRELTGMRIEEFRSDLYTAVPKTSDFGVAIVPPDFTFNTLRSGETIADVARAIASGVGGTAMPTWKNVLLDADIWAMAHYVRSLVALRDTPAVDQLRAQLAAQSPFVPPPPENAAPDRARLDAR